MEMKPKDAERFWSKVDKTGPGGCWVWTGYTHLGYGKFSLRVNGVEKNLRAHRVSYSLLVREVAPGEILDHLCRVRKCVNPEHLRIVTNRENVLCGIGPTAINAQKTHCANGHEFNEVNTRYLKTGERRCRLCVRMWSKESARVLTNCGQCGEVVQRGSMWRHRQKSHV